MPTLSLGNRKNNAARSHFKNVYAIANDGRFAGTTHTLDPAMFQSSGRCLAFLGAKRMSGKLSGLEP